MPEVTVRYVTSICELHHPDMIFLPGSKNTMGDLKWMRQNGLEAAVKKLSEDIPVFGICGGYQMLGKEISDPDGVEEGGNIRGMELLPVSTILMAEKKRCQIEGKIERLSGLFHILSDCAFKGYELHMGRTGTEEKVVVTSDMNENIYGSYVHGLFDEGIIANSMIQALAEKKGIEIENGEFEDYQTFKDKQYDKLADTLRMYLNMEEIYEMLREANLE